jgi:hypothetical protein
MMHDDYKPRAVVIRKIPFDWCMIYSRFLFLLLENVLIAGRNFLYKKQEVLQLFFLKRQVSFEEDSH